jgi:hypothetical protein
VASLGSGRLSAPWLVLPFIAGWTQRDAKRAAVLGLACTAAALFGYGAMTLSPVENSHANLQSIAAFVRSESRVIMAGLVTGPLFGWFGQQWRTRRAWLGALVTAVAVCCEPLARVPAGRAIRFQAVWIAEVAAGLALVAYIAVARARHRLRA